MSDRLCTPEEIYRVTRRTRYKAQCRRLTALGYRYKCASNGEPLLPFSALEVSGKVAQRQTSGPRWDRIGSVRQLRKAA